MTFLEKWLYLKNDLSGLSSNLKTVKKISIGLDNDYLGHGNNLSLFVIW